MWNRKTGDTTKRRWSPGRRRGPPGWPSLVLLDIQMPVLDGRGVVRALRERGVGVPVVVMTVVAQLRSTIRRYEPGREGGYRNPNRPLGCRSSPGAPRRNPNLVGECEPADPACPVFSKPEVTVRAHREAIRFTA